MKKTEVIIIRTTKPFKTCLNAIADGNNTSYIENKLIPEMEKIEIVQEKLSVIVRYNNKILEKRTAKNINELPEIINKLKEKWEV